LRMIKFSTSMTGKVCNEILINSKRVVSNCQHFDLWKHQYSCCKRFILYLQILFFNRLGILE
jgi:hypothetical protein